MAPSERDEDADVNGDGEPPRDGDARPELDVDPVIMCVTEAVMERTEKDAMALGERAEDADGDTLDDWQPVLDIDCEGEPEATLETLPDADSDGGCVDDSDGRGDAVDGAESVRVTETVTEIVDERVPPLVSETCGEADEPAVADSELDAADERLDDAEKDGDALLCDEVVLDVDTVGKSVAETDSDVHGERDGDGVILPDVETVAHGEADGDTCPDVLGDADTDAVRDGEPETLGLPEVEGLGESRLDELTVSV